MRYSPSSASYLVSLPCAAETPLRLFVTTGRGCEPALLEEINELKQRLSLKIEKGPFESIAGVSLDAPFETMVALNLGLSTASRVTWTLLECDVQDIDDLFSAASKVQWEKLFGAQKTFMVEGHCKDTFTTNSMFLALKVKDAVADAFRNAMGKRPDVDTRFPDVSLIVRLVGQRLTLAVDLSGETLSNHGYREVDVIAPLRENLAAALVRSAGWNALASSLLTDCEPAYLERVVPVKDANKERRIPARTPIIPRFLDPMCGSGTLVIEAALILLNKKPNARREHFAFEQLLPFSHDWATSSIREIRHALIDQEFDEDTLDEKLEKYHNALTRDGIEYKPSITPITGSDCDAKAIAATRRNAAAAGVDFLIGLSQTSFFDRKNEFEKGLLVTNPPYGERLNDPTEIIELYSHIGDALKKHFRGWNAWIVSNNTVALKHVGLRPTRKLAIFNGPLACQFQQYILY
jgi:23S rRNA G2445 N2-methylase RlmL